jgi:hypothetical protein
VVNPQTGNSDRIVTSDQLKKAVKQKSGQNLKTMKQFVDRLVAAGRDDLLVPVTRNSINMYVDADRLDEAMAVVYGGAKQRLISPVADNVLMKLQQYRMFLNQGVTIDSLQKIQANQG